MQYHPFQTSIQNNEIILKKNDITYSARKLDRLAVYAKGGLKITKARFQKEKPLKGSEQEIIKQIHKLRFGKDNPYVITGGHFSPLYVRNLGVFYNALLDSRIPDSDTDWLLRQEITLRTAALDLEIFRLAGKEFTTIYPLKGLLFTCHNVYTRPSDSLFAILYTLRALTDENFIAATFPANITSNKKLQTKKAGQKLLTEYKSTLEKLVTTYLDEVIDKQTGLIKLHLTLASARDGIKRQSSFYDNVIAWATIRLAGELGLMAVKNSKLTSWKTKIVETFWDKTTGIFLDDLSTFSKKHKLFCSDSFIVLSTGFFKTENKSDMEYLRQMVDYVKKKHLDMPFPIPYSILDLPKNLHRPVRHFAPSYAGTSIWSHWGMEYIKALIYLSSSNNHYLADAKKHLLSYKQNIESYGGYPELYDKNGKPLHQRLYHSVLHNGWVINYEQVKMLLSAR